MNKMKRYGALLLALAMTMCLALSASATPQDINGIDPPADNGTGKITVEKYDVKNVDTRYLQYGDGQALESGTVVYDDGTVQYTWGELTAGTAGTFETITTMAEVPFNVQFFPYDAANRTYKTVAEVIWATAPTGFAWNSTDLLYKIETDSNGQIVMDNLKHGMYVFTELDHNGYSAVDNPFTIYMPTQIKRTYDSTGQTIVTTWETDVHAYPKNTQVGKITKVLLDKTATNDYTLGAVPADSGLGNRFSYRITADIKNLSDKSFIEIEDKLDSTMIVESIKVEYQVGTAIPQSVTAYETTPATPKGAIDSLKVTLQDANLNAFKSTNADRLLVTVTVVTDPNEPMPSTRTIVNDATYTYRDDPNDPPPPPVTIPEDEKPKTDVGDIKIKKVGNDASNTPLGGAEFMLFTDEAAAKAGTPTDLNAIVADSTQLTAEDGRYTFIAETADGPSKGQVTINNIHRSHTPAGASATPQYFTYWLVETKAPEGGYNRLLDPVKVEFTDSVKDSTLEIEVINHKGFTLPRTGGSGTLLFTVIGLSLITIAGVILILYRRRRSKGQDVS